MLWKTIEMQHMSVMSQDGSAGKVEQFIFDDQSWSIRYLVIDIGPVLNSRRVIISPVAVDHVNYESLTVKISTKQIINSPDIDTTQPVSRQMEEEIHKHYAWPFYWLYPEGYNSLGGALYPGLSNPFMYPGASGDVAWSESDLFESHGENSRNSSHLRLSNEVTGYHIVATDGVIGHIDDFLVDDSLWIVKYCIADTRNFFPGRKVLISPHWIKEIKWSEAAIHVQFDRKTIRESPGYNPEVAVSEEYEQRLLGYYAPDNRTRFHSN